MHKQFIENLARIYKTATAPIKEIVELNANILAVSTKNIAILEELSQAKKTEDFIHTQTKLVNNSSKEVVTYVKKSADILEKYIADTNDIFESMLSQTASNLSEQLKTTTGSKN